MGRPATDITGKQFGSLQVIGRTAETTKSGEPIWALKCLDCGDSTGKTTSSSLKRGRRGFCPTCTTAKSKRSPLKTLYYNYARGAQKRKLPFELTIEQFENLIRQDCHYCGYPPSQVLKKDFSVYGITYSGIDRVDNDKGYTITNTVPCCKFCNMAKGRSTEDEYRAWMQHLRSNQSK